MKRGLVWITLFAAAGLGAPARAQWSYTEEARLVTGAGTPQWFGSSVDIDGSTAVVGSPTNTTSMAHAVVFVEQAAVWNHQADLVPAVMTDVRGYGWSIAIDGDTVVVGAPGTYINNQATAGAAYVFVRNGSSWSEQQKLVPSDSAAQIQFGWSVAVSGDTIAVGADQHNSPPLNPGAGATYIFVRNGTTWTEQQILVPGGNVYGARSGSAVALEGDRLLVGARTWTQQSPSIVGGVGAAYEFARTGSTWSQVAELHPTDPTQNKTFGCSVDLDGSRAVIGASGDKPPGHLPYGAAYVFKRAGGGWVQEQKLVGVGIDDQDYLGTSVAISGTTVVAGAINGNSTAAAGSGTLRWFELEGANWVERVDLYGSATTNGDKLGSAAALDGDRVIAGANMANTPLNGSSGEAYIWRLQPPATQAYCTAKTNSLGCVPAIATNGVPSVSSSAAFTITCSQVRNLKQGLLFYGYAPAAAPFQGGWLCVQPPTRRLPVQNSGGSAGNDCSGTYTYDFNAVIDSGDDPALVVGADAYCQFWTRDPQSASTTGLSGGLRAHIQP